MLGNLHFAHQVGGRKRQANAEELIDMLGIRHLLKRYPDTLSGGERQRVALGLPIAHGFRTHWNRGGMFVSLWSLPHL